VYSMVRQRARQAYRGMQGPSRDIPSDPIREVFTKEHLACLEARPNKSDRLKERLAVLGGNVSHQRYHRAQKGAWEAYLSAAFALGLFEQPHGEDLRARLTGDDDDAFRAAMAECMVGWVLAGKLKLNVTPRPEGRRGHPLEYLIHDKSGGIRVEVKSPYRPRPARGGWCGDDSDLLAAALKSANDQLESGVRNLLALAPSIRMPVYLDRGQLARAFYGQPLLTWPFDVTTGCAAGPTTIEFSPDGSFLNLRNRTGKLIKLDGMPAYTRVGAVVCIEEEPQSDNPPWIDHKILVAHNPYAADPTPQEIWGSIPQLIEVADGMAWNDSAKPF